MDWLRFLIEVLTLFAANGLFFYSINRKIKKLEVKDKEVDIVKKQDDEWLELYLESKEKIAKLEVAIQRMYDTNFLLKEENGNLKQENSNLTWYRCTINNCPNRKPPHVYDHNGNELEATIN